MDMLPLLFIIGLFVVGVPLMVSAVRIDIDGHWHRRWGHSCGYHTNSSRLLDGFCPACGEPVDQEEAMRSRLARARWPWGWEFKE